MATAGEGNHPSDEGAPQPVEEPQQLESRVARRRLSQARHRATLTGLFNNLRKAVYSPSDPTASKVRGPYGCGKHSSTGDCRVRQELASSCPPHCPEANWQRHGSLPAAEQPDIRGDIRGPGETCGKFASHVRGKGRKSKLLSSNSQNICYF